MLEAKTKNITKIAIKKLIRQEKKNNQTALGFN